MAESEARQPTETVRDEEKKLKYLDFVQGAFVYAVVCFSSIYDYAKENVGPLKPGVQTVEGAVQTVIGPVYAKFHDVPIELLEFIDHKMDEMLTEMDSHVPSLLKQASSGAMSAAHKAREMASEVQRVGFVKTGSNLAKTVYRKYEPTAKELYTKYEPMAKELYTKYEPVAKVYVVNTWQSLNKVPLFSHVAGIMVLTGVYWVEKYNQTVIYMSEKDFTVATYMPLVPVEKIGKIFEGEHGNDVTSNGEYEPMTQEEHVNDVATNGEYETTTQEEHENDVATNGEYETTTQEEHETTTQEEHENDVATNGEYETTTQEENVNDVATND